MKTQSLAIFDFDGTLTRSDSLLTFIKFAVPRYQFFLGCIILSPVLFFYAVGILSNSKAKELVMKYFFKGWDYAKFQNVCDEFSLKIIPEILRSDALDRLEWHIKNNHRIIVLTASPENWVKRWTDKNKIELIGTKLEVKEQKITGSFASLNCHGLEKVNRIHSYLELSNYFVYCYGDSIGDFPFLNLADEKYYKIFKE